MYNNSIDVTVDLETLATSPNSAILQIAAVAWNRSSTVNPLIEEPLPFSVAIDLRSCIYDGFDIDVETAHWWSNLPAAVKDVVLGQSEIYPLKDSLVELLAWFDEIKNYTGAQDIILWAQGTDFDIPIFRNAMKKYNLDFPVKHTNLRDSRSLIREVFPPIAFCKSGKVVSDDVSQEDVVKFLCPDVKVDGCKHDALYDATITTLAVWSILRSISI